MKSQLIAQEAQKFDKYLVENIQGKNPLDVAKIHITRMGVFAEIGGYREEFKYLLQEMAKAITVEDIILPMINTTIH